MISWYVKRDGKYWDLGDEWIEERDHACEFTSRRTARKVARRHGAKVVRVSVRAARRRG